MTTNKEYNIEEHVYVMLLELYKLECSSQFRKPVDVVALCCPNYYELIKEPMDLSTLKANYKNGKYRKVDEILKDLKQIVTNCRNFNPPQHAIIKTLDKFEQCIINRWKALQEKIKRLEFGTTLNIDSDKLDNIDWKKSKKRDPALPTNYQNQEPIKKKPKQIDPPTDSNNFEVKASIQPLIKKTIQTTNTNKQNESIFMDDEIQPQQKIQQEKQSQREPFQIQQQPHTQSQFQPQIQNKTQTSQIAHSSPSSKARDLILKTSSGIIGSILDKVKIEAPQSNNSREIINKFSSPELKNQISDRSKDEILQKSTPSLLKEEISIKNEFDDLLGDNEKPKYQIPIQHKSLERRKIQDPVETETSDKMKQVSRDQPSDFDSNNVKIEHTQLANLQTKIETDDPIQKLPIKSVQPALIEQSEQIKQESNSNLNSQQQLIRFKSNIEPPVQTFKKSNQDGLFKITLKKEEIYQAYKDNQIQKIRKNKKFIAKVLNAFVLSLQFQKDKIQKIHPGGNFVSLSLLETSYKQTISGNLNYSVEQNDLFLILKMQIMWLKHNLMNLVFSDLQDMHRYCNLVCRSLKVLKLAQKRFDRLKDGLPKSAQKESQESKTNLENKPQQETIEQISIKFEIELANEVKLYLKTQPTLQIQKQTSTQQQNLEYFPNYNSDKRLDQQNNHFAIPALKQTTSVISQEDEEQGKENIFQVYLQNYNDKFNTESNLLAHINYKKLFKERRKQQIEKIEEEQTILKLDVSLELFPSKKQKIIQNFSVFDEWPTENDSIEPYRKENEYTFNQEIDQDVMIDQDLMVDQERLEKINYIVTRIQEFKQSLFQKKLIIQ